MSNRSSIDPNANNSSISEIPNANNLIISRGSATSFPIPLHPNQNDRMVPRPMNASHRDTTDVVGNSKLTYDSLKLTNETNVNYSSNLHNLDFRNQEYHWTKYCNLKTDSSSKESNTSIDNVKTSKENSISTKSDDSTSKETSLVSTNNNQIVPYECISQNLNVPMDDYMITFKMKNPDLNRQFDNCIDFNNTSPSDIVLLKQYVYADFK